MRERERDRNFRNAIPNIIRNVEFCLSKRLCDSVAVTNTTHLYEY